jgi:hypothetical protein
MSAAPAALLPTAFPRRDGRVAEGARLESVCTRKGTQGSNPCLSAISYIISITCKQYTGLALRYWITSLTTSLFPSRHRLSQSLAVHVHRGLDVRVPHQVLLHRHWRLGLVEPRTIRVPRRVPADLAGTCAFTRRNQAVTLDHPSRCAENGAVAICPQVTVPRQTTGRG